MAESIGEYTDINSLIPHPDNPRINDHAVEELAKSIKRFGFAAPIIARSEDKMIIAGHTRWKAAKHLNLDQVPVRYMDLDPVDAKLLMLADNKIGERADWDEDQLAKLFEELKDEDLNGLGWDENEIGDILGDLYSEDEINEDINLESEDPVTEIGDVWILGEHLLVCGDSTKRETLVSIMNDSMADLLITDPPYNVAYTGKTNDALTIQNDSMEDAEFRSFLSEAFQNADDFMKAGAAFYIWHADSEGYNFRGACRDVDWQVRQCLIWVKNIFVMGRQDYHWRHEPCLYGWKSGAAHKWCNDRKQDTILKFDRPMSSREHPTMKPISLFSYQIKNNTKPGDIVLDLFGGSGTTLISCELSKRKARLIELDPKYCDVIVNRWHELTGEEAKTIDGKGFNGPKE